MSTAEIVGVYIVKESSDVHMIEMIVNEHVDSRKIGEITQEIDNLGKDSWQVPYDEYFLDPTGTEIVGDFFINPKSLSQKTRLTFFFFYLDFSKVLLTPFGCLELPKPEIMPFRLEKLITFEDVD